MLSRFVDLAGGPQAKLVVIPTAASEASIANRQALVRRWTERGIRTVSVLHTRDRKEADSAEFIQPLSKATAVWFGGGQQSRLAKAYLGTATERAIVALFRRGGVIGGTSAGAAIQSRVMIESGNPVPKVTTGLDLLPGAVIDQHFLRRNRINRLLTAIRQHPDRIGVGIDEATALVFQRGRCQVLGDSYLTVIVAPQNEKPLSMQTFRAGQSFRLDALGH